MLVHIQQANVSLVPSFHRLPQSFVLPTYIANAARRAAKVIFERDLDEPFAAPQVTSARLEDLLAAGELADLRKVWTGSAVQHTENELNSISAGAAAEIIDEAVAANCFLLDSKWGIDRRVWEGVEPSKRAFIDSSQTLCELLSVYPESEQVEDLKYAINIKQRAEDFRAELGAWCTGNIEMLGKLTDCIYKRTPVMASRLLDLRNQTMLRRIDVALSSTGGYLFVIGAAHVLGEFGLLKKLEERGYKFSVEPQPKLST